MQSITTPTTTKGRHELPVPSRISGQIDAMWCGRTMANHFAYATKRLPRPKELLFT
jgi:hypothetical protein